MEIKDYHSINKAKIEINKINVIGGVNGSGKSTVSRILYSFLKANSIQRKDFILKNVITRINKLLNALNIRNNSYDLPQSLTINDDLSYINHILNRILEISKDFDKIAIKKKEKFIKEFNSLKESLINEGTDITDIEYNFNSKIDNSYYIKHNLVNSLFGGYSFNIDRFNEVLRLEYIWEEFQYYSSNIYDECLDIDSEIEEFLINDNPSISEKVFNRILLKEHISANFNKNVDLKMIIDGINKIIEILNFEASPTKIEILNFEGNTFDLPIPLTTEDHFSDIIETLSILLEISKDYDKLAKINKNELKKEMMAKFETIIKILIDKNIDVSEIESALYSTNDDMYTDSESYIHFIFEENNLFLDYSDDCYELSKLVDSYNYFNIYSDIYDRCVAIESIIHDFFDEKTLLQNDQSINELLLTDDYIKDFNNNIIQMIFREQDSFSYFFNNFINSVYYVDNVSIFDVNHEKMVLTNRFFHMDELIEDIYGDTYTYELNEDFKNIMEKIDNIIKGRYNQNFPDFVSDKKNDPLTFIKSHRMNVVTSNTTTPSGVKQIGIVQLLLLNGKLKKEGYLIIDEPEVNLHPEWQFKFAEILVLLAKELNITIYLNSHSPMFIEAIDAFTEVYDMEDEINYYLTKESDVNGKYDFIKINSDELYKIYDNLGNAYDWIDQLRLKKHLGV